MDDREVDIHLVVGLPPNEASASVKDAAQNALAILRDQLETAKRAEVVPEGEAPALAERIANDIIGHDSQ